MAQTHGRSVMAWFGKLSGWEEIEKLVVALIAIVMTVLAILLLGLSVLDLFNAARVGELRDNAIEILNSILLVMMISEIVHTATMSLKNMKDKTHEKRLEAEPFLIVGVIAAIRRMLVITAESTRFEEANPDVFQNTLIELGLLAVTIILIALSISILRRSLKTGELA